MNRDDSYGNISISLNSKYVETRATKTPAFWEYPTPPHDYPYYQFISDPFHSKSKLRCAGGIITNPWNVAIFGYSNYYIYIKFKSSSVKMAPGMQKKVQIRYIIMRIFNEGQWLILYPTNLLLRGYFHTKNDKKSCPLNVIPTYVGIQRCMTRSWCGKSWYKQFLQKSAKSQHATHLLKLVDKMCKYEMGLASIVEDTDTISSTDGRVDGRRTEWNQYISFPSPPLTWGIIMVFCKHTALIWHVLGITSMFYFLKILYSDF